MSKSTYQIYNSQEKSVAKTLQFSATILQRLMFGGRSNWQYICRQNKSKKIRI
jgi:hypothetical protein